MAIVMVTGGVLSPVFVLLSRIQPRLCDCLRHAQRRPARLLPPPTGPGGLSRLRRRPPTLPNTNPFGLDTPTATTAHRESPTARRPRHLGSAAVSPASTAGRRAFRSSF
ncbi:hypothetical protein SETIT_2G151600v2 [Setaria italica]|uniref:Uncharacterized protein n=1 Tax=Setaria italica TaxID=4555 RepID=A0A368PZ97_SETIT|nr:hypothetical protein SETIT_2G151600v2 [Setaria italica]